MATDPVQADAERKQTLAFARMHLTPLQLELWMRSEYTERMYLTAHTRLELVSKLDGQLVTRKVFGDMRLSASFQDGLVLRMRDEEGEELVVTHVPRLLPEHDVFVWLPSHRPDFRFTLHGSSVNFAYRSVQAPSELFGVTTYLRKT